MIHRLTRKVRQIRRNMEAARRQFKLHDSMAYQGETWDLAKWRRVMRYDGRLHRLSYGRPPF